MVTTFRVFKKTSPNGKLTVYVTRRDIVDHFTHTDPIDGVVVFNEDGKDDKKIVGEVVATFRYGREEDEVMGLHFYKDLYLATEQLYPQLQQKFPLTKMQERLLRQLGPNAAPFRFQLPQTAPASVTLQPGPEDQGKPCGVEYQIRVFTADKAHERTNKSSSVAMAFRKIQFAPNDKGLQPCTVVRKDFLLSSGPLELEVTLDKQLYYHGEKISVNICIRNHSNKTVKRMKASVVQITEVCMFAHGQYRTTVASLQTEEGCPIAPGSTLQKIVHLIPLLEYNKDRRGVALDGRMKNEDTNLASSTLLLDPDHRDVFGIIVSYVAKVKLFLGALGGELIAELPFVLMHPKPNPRRLIHADSQAEVENILSSRQNTVDDESQDAAESTTSESVGMLKAE